MLAYRKLIFFSFCNNLFFHKNALMVKSNIFSNIVFLYIQEILITELLDFLPLKVMHNIKYSCSKPQFIGKIESNKILVFTKICLIEIFLSGYSITVPISKLVNLKLNFFENFLCASRTSKLLQVYLITYAHFVIVEHCQPFPRNLSVKC